MIWLLRLPALCGIGLSIFGYTLGQTGGEPADQSQPFSWNGTQRVLLVHHGDGNKLECDIEAPDGQSQAVEAYFTGRSLLGVPGRAVEPWQHGPADITCASARAFVGGSAALVNFWYVGLILAAAAGVGSFAMARRRGST
ncbi:hypothetical protein FB566_1200 [Stackebrandtia endophytica]|uniref:Uncharacterized protein n=1 Tax=Stackebrandtia endophytica TaxID=1496996 RepID=A0A543ASX5_9ACTN|nr:hypothetical protein [Stackebrandtia endophytica]TQL75689.1 hypothetical protein FB566_1200 [Stackebrandtia endophytica]